METIDDIRAALGASRKPRVSGQPGDNGEPTEDKRRRDAQRPKRRFPGEFDLFSPESVDLSRGRFPGRGLLYSFLFHEIAVFLLLLSPSYIIERTKEYRPVNDEPLFIDAEVLKAYLPSVGGGKESKPEGASKGKGGQKGDAAPASEGHKGFTYPGPQPIVSVPPVPDNTVQTIRQPDLVKPQVIKVPVVLPNQVQIAAPKAPDLKGTTAHALEIPVSVPPAPPPPPQVKPKLVLPPPKPELAALPTEAVQDVAQSAPKLSAPKPPPPKVLPSSGDQMRNLAVLSPVLNKATEVAEIPLGEKRGSFAIGPPALKVKSPEPGGGTGNAPGAGRSTAATAATGTGSGGANATGHGASAGSGLVAGNGLGTGSATGTGLGRAGTGPGAGGSGTGKGSGTGAGIGPGHGPFPGLAIEGGVGAGGSIPRGLHMNFGPDKSYNYGMTVEAEGKSGGGLRDFGVFRDEPVYTVYVDVPQPRPSMAPWTLEYAVLDPPSSSGVVMLKKVAAPAPENVIAPFPTTKEDPKLPWDLVKQYPGRMVVVYAEISPEGKLRKIHILDSPDIELSQLLLQALVKWEFKPAIVNGKPVAVKTLFGVPLAPPEKAVDHAPVAPVDHKPVPPVEHHAPAPPPLAHAPAPTPLKHVAPPPPLKHAPAPPSLHHESNEVQSLTLSTAAPSPTKLPASPAKKKPGDKSEVRSLDLK